MNAHLRRGACPGLSAPMRTGDGLLVRILPTNRISPDALIALCAAARAHGNGIIEVTSRGSVQVRGLTKKSARSFAAEIAALDIAEKCPVPVIADLLVNDPGELIDAGAVASSVRMAIDAAGFVVAPKVSVVIDGGSRLHLDALSADVRLRAFKTARAIRFHVALGGDARSATPLGACTLENATGMVVRLLGVIAARSRTARAADILHNRGIAPFQAAVADQIEAAPTLTVRSPIGTVGPHSLRGSRIAFSIAFPFGQTDAETLSQLARLAADHGVHTLRPAPGRVLLLSEIADSSVAALAASAENLGFVVRPDDPRRRIAACPGKPACISGWIPARALAAEVAKHLPPHAGEINIHVSGCAKGCAHPASAALTVVGNERGCGIVHRGSTRIAPRQYVDPESLVTEIMRAVNSGESFHD